MFRIGLKFPCNNGLNRVKKHGYTRFHFLARNYETRARIKSQQDQRFLKDAKLLCRFSRAPYSANAPEGTKNKGIRIASLIVVAVGISGSLLVYAKYDPKFRATLEQYIPGIDKALSLIFLEDLFDGDSSPSSTTIKEGFNVISGLGSKDRSVEKKSSKVAESASEKDLLAASVADLEKDCGIAAATAISMYEEAARINEDYKRYIVNILESAATAVDNVQWEKLKEATEQRNNLQTQLAKQSTETLNSLNKLSTLIEEKRFETSPSLMNATKANVTKMIESVHAARSKYESSEKAGKASEHYWQRIRAARDVFNKELQILFPHVNLEDKTFQGSNEAFDLFIYYMYNKVSYLQKELEKMKTLEEVKLQSALRGSGDALTQERLNTLVDLQVASKMRSTQEEFDRLMLEQEKNHTDDLRQQLKLQLELHTDHLREALTEKEREHQRELSLAVSKQVVDDQKEHNTKFATVVGRIRALEKTLKSVLEEERKATNLQILWSSCQALVRALKHGPPGISADEAIKPLEPMLNAISKATPKDDPLVLAAIQSVPEVATKRGVYPESTLRQRFLKVEKVAKKLAMVPAEGASLPMYFLSYLQSVLVINSGYAISKRELQDAPIDVQSLNTYEILNRARYWIDQGDFKMCLRYMNLLKGAPRSIARDWMNEVRILLETQQAVNIFNAYAAALGLTFISSGPSK